MLEILPGIDLRGGRCVRLRQGDYNQETVFSDDPVAMAVQWASAGETRLHLVDLDGAKAGQPVNHEVVRSIRQAVDIPCQLGGGIRNIEAIKLLLDEIGVDRIIVGTQALRAPDWFIEVAQQFPGRICLGLDARDSMVATSGWLDVSQTPALELARTFAGVELAAVIYTNIANDGMMQGIDEQTISDMLALARLGLPVIASGGVTSLRDVERLCEVHREEPRLHAAIIGRALYEGAIRVQDAVQMASVCGRSAATE